MEPIEGVWRTETSSFVNFQRDIKDNFIGVAEEVDATGQIILANGKVRLLDLDFEDTLTYTITPLTFFGQLTSPDRFSIELITED